jgi:hypothetical protein
MRTILILLISSSLLMAADSFRVHYSIHGSGRDITVQADSSSDARKTVMKDVSRCAVATSVSRRK